VRGRCGTTHIHVVHRFRVQRIYPELRHGNIDHALVQQRVFGYFKSDARRFRITLHTALVEFALHRSVELIGIHIGQRAAKVPQETITDVRVLDNMSDENRQIGSRIVSSSVLELRDHVIRPVLHARFPAVHGHEMERRTCQSAQLFGNRIQIALEVLLDIPLNLSTSRPLPEGTGGRFLAPLSVCPSARPSIFRAGLPMQHASRTWWFHARRHRRAKADGCRLSSPRPAGPVR
jgi:hypothetical protein